MTFKSGDIFISIISVFIITFYIINTISNSHNNNNHIHIDFDGKEYVYPLESDREVLLENEKGFVSFSILDHKVFVTEASCRNKLCIKMGEIERGGESIACLPNRCLITIKGEDESEVDVVSW